MTTDNVEYKEVNAYLRHYSSLRFVMVSVYFAVSAVVVSAAFRLVGTEGSITTILAFTFRIIGLGITIVFSAYEWRLEKLIRFYQGRARDIEKDLPYNTMQERPQSNLMFYATRGLYTMFILFWLIFAIMVRIV